MTIFILKQFIKPNISNPRPPKGLNDLWQTVRSENNEPSFYLKVVYFQFYWYLKSCKLWNNFFLVHDYFYILLCNSINEKCETVVYSPLHLVGLPDFLSNSAICPTGNITTFDTDLPSRLLHKNYISDRGTYSPVQAQGASRWSGWPNGETYH